MYFWMSIFLFILRRNHSSITPPNALQSLYAPSRTFVFYCPPASFVHHQVTVALELHRRGHRVVFITLHGFQRHLDSQLKFFDAGDAKLIPIEILELKDEMRSDLLSSVGYLTQTVRSFGHLRNLRDLMNPFLLRLFLSMIQSTVSLVDNLY